MSRLFVFIFSVSTLLVLSCSGNLMAGEDAVMLDFDELAEGTFYSIHNSIDLAGASIDVSDSLIYITPADPNGDPNEHVLISDEILAGGTGNELEVLNVMLDFDFKVSVDSAEFRFYPDKGNLNLRINGELVTFDDILEVDGLTAGGCEVSVIPKDQGRYAVSFSGIIYSFAFGGEHFRMDDVVFTGTSPISYHVDIEGCDSNTGLSKTSAFATIQKAIDTAREGETVLVHPGVYTQRISFAGKAITVKNASEPPVLKAPENIAVSFYTGERNDSVLKNFIIVNSEIAISCNLSSPTIKNVTVANNNFGITVYGQPVPDISNSIFWANKHGDLSGINVRFSCTQIPHPGIGNISVNPLFVTQGHWDWNQTSDPNDDIWVEGDYRLKSSGWRYSRYHLHGTNWTYDPVTSRCIDAGNPSSDLEGEAMTLSVDPDNKWAVNKRVNMGAYGATHQASMAPEGHVLLSDISNDGIVNYSDLSALSGCWNDIADQMPGDFNRDDVVDINDLAVQTDQWLNTTDWFHVVDMMEYWPISEGDKWRSLTEGDEQFRLEAAQSLDINGVSVWKFDNEYTIGDEVIQEDSYYFHVSGQMYSTTDSNDLDQLPYELKDVQSEYPRYIYPGNQFEISSVGLVYVVQGTLKEVLQYSQLMPDDFPGGEYEDVVAFVTNYDQPGQRVAAIFARDKGPLLMNTRYTSSLIIDYTLPQ